MSAIERPLAAMSTALTEIVEDAATRVAMVGEGRHALSALILGSGTVISSEEGLRIDEGLPLALPDGETREAAVKGRDPSRNVALLDAVADGVPGWSRAPIPKPGAIAIAVGRGPDGPLAALSMVVETGPAWESAAGGTIDALIRLGDLMPPRIEGGAVVDAEGRLIGLAAADPRSRGLVIPAETVERSAARISETGSVGRGYLGLALRPVRTSEVEGLMVVEIADKGPGAAAGFVLGDLLTALDDHPVGGIRTLGRRLGGEMVGKMVRAAILRGGQPMELRVTVGERRRSA